MKRKKRAKRAIESFEKQIKLHKDKQKKAIEEGNKELYEYYNKEIQKFKKQKERRKEILNK